jgi:pimeloyl-ACP methyl ester carboxylesterase
VVLSVLDALGIGRAVLVGYDIGSSIAVQIARDAPDRVLGLALGNPMNPAAGPLLLSPAHRGEFWYQDFHQLELASALVDGEPRAVAAYLAHFYRHWSGRREPLGPAHLAALVRYYAEPGAFTASLNWYRSGSSSLPVALAAAEGSAGGAAPPVRVPSAVVWGAADPLFPVSFSEGLETVLPGHSMTVLDDVGHFVPLEAPAALAAAVRSLLPAG